MSEVRVIYDIDTEVWEVNATGVDSFSCNVSFTFLRSVTNGKFFGLNYGLALLKDDETISDYTSSLESLQIVNTGKFSPGSIQLTSEPDTEYVLKLWVNFQGIRKDNEVTFSTPRPQKPYPSYVWQNNRWTAPTPFPGDDQQYMWDEATLSWVSEQQ
jgi:hypothetical protein